MKKFIQTFSILCCLFLFSSNISAQKRNIIDGDIMVKLEEGVDIQSFCRDFEYLKREAINLKPDRRLAQSINLWLLKYDFQNVLPHLMMLNLKVNGI